MFVDGSFDIIEKTLKDYEELTNKPVMLYGKTHEKTQALIDTICKNYKEVKITNLEDEKKLKALEIIIDKQVDIRIFISSAILGNHEEPDAYNFIVSDVKRHLTKEEFDLLKEVLKNE